MEGHKMKTKHATGSTNLRHIDGILTELEEIVDNVKQGADLKEENIKVAACKHALQAHAIEIMREKIENGYSGRPNLPQM